MSLKSTFCNNEPEIKEECPFCFLKEHKKDFQVCVSPSKPPSYCLSSDTHATASEAYLTSANSAFVLVQHEHDPTWRNVSVARKVMFARVEIGTFYLTGDGKRKTSHKVQPQGVASQTS